jgi:RimJ/RimL family protein N-acetyltransferase
MSEIPTVVSGLYLDHLTDPAFLELHTELGSQPTLLKPEFFGKEGWAKAMLEERRIMSILSPGFMPFGIVKENIPIGEICVFPQCDEPKVAELSWEVIETYRGKGYATAAAQALIVRGLKELGLVKVFARIAKDNEASIKVARKIGLSSTNSNKGLLEFIHDLA